MRRYNYEIGDYVKYEGDSGSAVEILRTPDIARIEDFGNDVGNGERIYIHLVGKNQDAWCDFRDIRQILTTEQHLTKLGFQSDVVNGVKRYRLGAVTITGALVRTPATTYWFDYCVADFSTHPINIDTYLRADGKMDLEHFFNDHPSVSNINDLFGFLEAQGRQFNKIAVLS